MRIKTTTSSVILLSAAAIVITGCQQTRLIFQPTVRQSRAVPSPVLRTAIQNHPEAEQVSADPPATEPASKDVMDTADVVAVATVDQAPPAIAYTAPPAWVRELVLMVVGSVRLSGGASDTGAGREVSESLVHSAAGVTGRLGLSAPPTTVGGAVVSRIGLRNLSLATIGFGSSNNIHTLQRNPATGPGGRCAELARAGLMADHAACAGGARRR